MFIIILKRGSREGSAKYLCKYIINHTILESLVIRARLSLKGRVNVLLTILDMSGTPSNILLYFIIFR
jgi:hypothetical protein